MADNNNIEIRPELFDKVDETKKAFETYFRDNYKDLQNLYNKMCDSKDFKGQAVDGFRNFWYTFTVSKWHNWNYASIIWIN